MDADQARGELTEQRRGLTELGARSEDRRDVDADGQGMPGQHQQDQGGEPEDFLDARAMEEDTRRQVEQIDAALARLDDGTWGRCVVCDREIDEERLEARPQADRCREHQDELERSAR